MFWNKKKKKEKAAASQPAPQFPGMVFKTDKDGNKTMSLDFDAPSNSVRYETPKIVSDRLYVISRDNIDLRGAQDITIHASVQHPEYLEYLISDKSEKSKDLVWCSAYPDSIFGEIPLPTLLIGYIKQSEGDKYLQGDSQLIQIKGEKDGYEYYILIKVHLE